MVPISNERTAKRMWPRASHVSASQGTEGAKNLGARNNEQKRHVARLSLNVFPTCYL